jgi:hypothetical protein
LEFVFFLPPPAQAEMDSKSDKEVTVIRYVMLLRLIPGNSTPMKGSQRAYAHIVLSCERRFRAEGAVVWIVSVAWAGLPPGVTELGLMVHVLRLGAPVQDSEIAEVNAPPSGVTVRLVLAVPPALTERELLAGAMEKSTTPTCAEEAELLPTKLVSPL